MTSNKTKMARKKASDDSRSVKRKLTDAEAKRFGMFDDSGFAHDDYIPSIETDTGYVEEIRKLTNDAIADHVARGQYVDGIVNDVKSLLAEGLSLDELLELLVKTHTESFEDIKGLLK